MSGLALLYIVCLYMYMSVCERGVGQDSDDEHEAVYLFKRDTRVGIKAGHEPIPFSDNTIFVTKAARVLFVCFGFSDCRA